MNRKLLVAAAALLLSACSAHAACTNQVGGIVPLDVGSVQHITLVDKTSCAQVGPTGVIVSNPVHMAVVADATGFNVTGTSATPFPGFEAVTFALAGYGTLSLSFAVSVPLLDMVATRP